MGRGDPQQLPLSERRYGNVVGSVTGEELVQSASAVSDDDNGYPTTALLGVDAEFTQTEAAAGAMGTLLARPVVGFNSLDYTYVKDGDSVHIVQDFRRAGSGEARPPSAPH